MLEGTYKGKYIGKSTCGFMTGFEYEFELSNNGRTYHINAYNNITLNIEEKLNISYASENSINNNWEIIH